MRILIVAVGKAKDRALRDLLDEYYSRVRRHVPCDEIELRDGKGVDQAIIGAIPNGAHVVALEVEGKQLTSPELAQRLVQWGTTGKGIVAFVIGGADGLADTVLKRANDKLSLSRLTMAHRVARVALAEQVYRAVSIWRGEPYHRD